MRLHTSNDDTSVCCSISHRISGQQVGGEGKERDFRPRHAGRVREDGTENVAQETCEDADQSAVQNQGQGEGHCADVGILCISHWVFEVVFTLVTRGRIFDVGVKIEPNGGFFDVSPENARHPM